MGVQGSRMAACSEHDAPLHVARSALNAGSNNSSSVPPAPDTPCSTTPSSAARTPRRRTLRSLEALPASSSTSAVRYSAGGRENVQHSSSEDGEVLLPQQRASACAPAGQQRSLKGWDRTPGCPNSPRMAAVYTAAVAPTRPLAVTRACRRRSKEQGQKTVDQPAHAQRRRGNACGRVPGTP